MASTCPATACSRLVVVTLIVAAVASLACSSTVPAPLSVDPCTTTDLDRLLCSYRPGQLPSQTAAALSDDRLAVIRAVVWAGMMPLTHNGQPLGQRRRLIDYVTKVDGIWGVRKDEPEGKYQFRLSVRLARDLVGTLVTSDEFDESGFCHVITGNDDPANTNPPLSVKAGRCFRGVDFPSVQVSFARENPVNGDMTGEIDIDFDPWTLGDWGKCHGRPSNSDVRSWSSTRDNHPAEFDAAFAKFGGRLGLKCTQTRFHCEKKYADRDCR